jgi:hypothetical protein
LLLTVRCTNRYLDVRKLTALRTQISGPLSSVRLRLDDGDGIFEPASDVEIGSGTPSNGAWTATGLSVTLAVGGSQTLYLSGDVSVDRSRSWQQRRRRSRRPHRPFLGDGDRGRGGLPAAELRDGGDPRSGPSANRFRPDRRRHDRRRDDRTSAAASCACRAMAAAPIS